MLLRLVPLLLFLAPFAGFLLWRQLRPRGVPGQPDLPWPFLALAGAGLALAVAGLVAYGLSRRMEQGSTYVPARLAPDGRIERGHAGPPR
ncbi:hypothetical protein MVG78_19020 [Roseomonas gilardii subsp. gilardii]|uniref:hypothetical protein n=1 Tax=Roseomonas gilardii TaxID=257708 RepID=UPI001FFA3BCD|nr:hypothetical protein [Roseomonas gilardii]UPG72536.1 hypothetical protein MVG78_19020 [Roseomonas gilardii subsp. gilardii]